MGKIYEYDPDEYNKASLARQMIVPVLKLKELGYGNREVYEFMGILLGLDLHPIPAETRHYEELIEDMIEVCGTKDLDVIKEKFGDVGRKGDAA